MRGQFAFLAVAWLASAQALPAQGSTATAAAVDELIALDQTDETKIVVPSLDYATDPAWEKDFDKYYYFHRADTGFPAALADLRDCDGLSRGLSSPYGYVNAPYPNTYTAGGVMGAAIGNAMVAAIFGSAQARATRRVNMRRCMFYKGYQRYGLPKPIWEKFNFEEGLSELGEDKRQAFLKQQAKVASGDRPKTGALGR